VAGVPERLHRPPGPLLVAVDHCFAIRGQGTVLTGTVLQGSVKVGDTVEIPELRLQRKVRSIQMFKAPVQQAQCGDRAAVAVTQLDAASVERGLLAAPESVSTFPAAVALVDKIRFYAGEVRSKSRLHVSVGHVTVMADLSFFGVPDGEGDVSGGVGAGGLDGAMARLEQLTLKGTGPAFDFERQYLDQEQLYGLEGRPTAMAGGEEQGKEAGSEGDIRHHGPQWALLRFSQPVTAPVDSLVVGSKLDTDASAAMCRLAFSGRLVAPLDASNPQQLARLRVFRVKQREGVVERVNKDGCTAVCRGMFKKETDIGHFAGMQVSTPGGITGVLEGAFGKSGKFSVRFTAAVAAGSAVKLSFKKFLHDPDKRRMAQ